MMAGRTADGGRLVVVGPGRVGLSLAAALADSVPLVSVEVRGRSDERPSFLRGRPAIASGRGPLGALEPGTRLVFTVPDDALAETVREWAEAWRAAGHGMSAGHEASAAPAREDAPRAAEPPVALHTSGVHPASVLAPLGELGASVAAWHPLTAVARPDARALRGVTWGLEGDERARAVAARLTRALDGRTLPVAPGEHARYHAAAVFASNFLVACLGAAAAELGAALEPGASAGLGDLLPLARAALAQVEREGPEAGLTGPVARGDPGTVRAHLEALSPERRSLYRGLARELLRLAAPGLAPERAAELAEALDAGHADTRSRSEEGHP